MLYFIIREVSLFHYFFLLVVKESVNSPPPLSPPPHPPRIFFCLRFVFFFLLAFFTAVLRLDAFFALFFLGAVRFLEVTPRALNSFCNIWMLYISCTNKIYTLDFKECRSAIFSLYRFPFAVSILYLSLNDMFYHLHVHFSVIVYL